MVQCKLVLREYLLSCGEIPPFPLPPLPPPFSTYVVLPFLSPPVTPTTPLQSPIHPTTVCLSVSPHPTVSLCVSSTFYSMFLCLLYFLQYISVSLLLSTVCLCVSSTPYSMSLCLLYTTHYSMSLCLLYTLQYVYVSPLSLPPPP